MATSFKVPASPNRDVLEIDNFLGVDLTNTGSNISEMRSPNAPNMIRDVPGKVRKRMGYKVEKDFKNDFSSGSDTIVYGAQRINDTEEYDGMSLYQKNRVIAANNSFVYGSLRPGWEAHLDLGNTIPSGIPTSLYLEYSVYGTDEALSYLVIDLVISGEESGNQRYRLEKGTGKTTLKVVIDSGVNDIYFECNGSNTALFLNYHYKIFVAQQSEGDRTPVEEIEYAPSPESMGEIFSPEKFYDFKSAESTILSAFTAVYSNDYIHRIYTTSKNLNITNFNILKTYRLKGNIKVTACTFNTSSNTSKIILCIKYNTYNGNYYSDIVSVPYKKNTQIDISAYIKAPNEIKYYGLSSATIMAILYGHNLATQETGVFTVDFGEFTIQEVEPKYKFTVKEEKTLIHVGNRMYLQKGTNYTLLFSEMNNKRSNYWQLERNIYVADGRNYLVYDDTTATLTKVYGGEKTYVPTLTIAKPTKYGTSASATEYEAINLLTPAFKERFTSQGDTRTNKICQMSRAPLDSASSVKVWVMDSDGSFVEKTYGTDYSVNATTATITFKYDIGDPPLTGEDNIIIQAERTPESYKDRINKCRFGALFGVNGASDRLFLSGNPNYLNYDWYSGYYDFTYFPDNGYSKLGLDSSAIVGYSIINNYLATHKDKNEPTQGVIIREGDLIDDQPAFKIINTLQGEGAIAPFSFAYLETEPLFLTRSGVFAITASDVTGEKYSQNRSFYLNGKLTQEVGGSDAYAIVYNDMYWLFLNNKAYVLDGLQAMPTDKSEPYATRQYAGFLLTNLPVYVAWENNGSLWFGTTDGKVCRFYSDTTALESYNDNGSAIEAWWETPDLDGNLFYKNKTFRYIAVRLKSSIKTGAKLYSQVRGLWTLFKNCRNVSNVVFKFSEISFSGFTFNHDTSDKVISSKLRVKKIDKARFKIENSELNEPFGIQNIAFEYVERGNFKG